MKSSTNTLDPQQIARSLVTDTDVLSIHNTQAERAVVRKYAKILKRADPEVVLDAARTLLFEYSYRWQSYELIESHPGAFGRMDSIQLEIFGQGINSWWSVDSFARTLAGPAWRKGQVPDELIHRWACSPDLWWRRAALVSTVAWNVRSKGGKGEPQRTLAVCRMLAADHEDMVLKALSWALRELIVHDPDAVRSFLDQNENVLAARVKREVRNKLTSGLKNPQRRRKSC